jgi:hypothetical protein
MSRRLCALAVAVPAVLLVRSLRRPSDEEPQAVDQRRDLTVQELKRMRRVADTMLSAHSRLRDRYRRRALALTLLIIALSILAASLAFAAGDSTVALVYIHARLSRWVAVLSLLIFFVGMADLVLDWRVRALEHDQAATRLGELKQRLRGPQVQDGQVLGGEGIEVDYERTMSLITPIPDAQFAPLKARHAYKVALSQAVDAHPGAPAWWLRLVVRFNGIRSKQPPPAAATKEHLEDLDRGAG